MKRILCTIVFIAANLICSSSANYHGYKVYETTPNSLNQLNVLIHLSENNDYDFWVQPRGLDQSTHVMIQPDDQKQFENVLQTHGIKFHTLIDNVQQSIKNEDAQQTLRYLARSQTAGDVTFTHYMHHHEMNNYLKKLASEYSDIVTAVDFGTSLEGREMILLEISTNKSTFGVDKPIIFIDAGIHAREWIAPPTALYLIQQLVENSDNRAMLENIDWAIIPCLNPDGYEFTQTGDRMWRKTRRSPNITDCYGVDGNRNFDYQWMTGGSSSNECSSTYAGPVPFSEAETTYLRDYATKYKDNIKLYLTIHSYGNMLLYPWGYTADLPDDEAELRYLAEQVNNAISSVNGTQYIIGTSTNVLYIASGGSDDYMKGALGIELSYTIELPGGGSAGFNPSTDRILPIVIEMFEGFKAYHTYIEEKFVFNVTHNIPSTRN